MHHLKFVRNISKNSMWDLTLYQYTNTVTFHINLFSAKRSITFSATILGGHVTTVAGQVIKFNRVYVNDGNGYSTITGIFTVPEAGLYQFSWDVLKYTGSGLDVDFYVNNNLTHTSWMPGYKGYEARTGILFLHMRSGDRVYLKTRHGGQKLHGSGKNNAGYCLFNGIRL